MKMHKKSNSILKIKTKRNNSTKHNAIKKFKRTIESETQYNIFIFIKIVFIFISFIIIIYFATKPKPKYQKLDSNFLDKNNNNAYTYSLYEKYKKIKFENTTCNILDPIKIFGDRLKNTHIEICNEKNTKHICYTDKPGYYSNISLNKNGTICVRENI